MNSVGFFFELTGIDASKTDTQSGPCARESAMRSLPNKMQMKVRQEPRKLLQDEKCNKTIGQIEALMMRYQTLVKALDCATARLLICTQAGGSLHRRFENDFGPRLEMRVTFD